MASTLTCIGNRYGSEDTDLSAKEDPLQSEHMAWGAEQIIAAEVDLPGS